MSAGRRSAALVALFVLAACGTTAPTTAGGPATPETPAGGTITVLAAASLTGAFTEIGQDFEAQAPGRKVVFSFGASSTLATQITQGAPADVFAAASPATMKTVTDAGAAADPVTFVSNTLQIAVPTGNPGQVTGLADFADAELKIAICAPEVPCGAAAAKVFAAAGVRARPDTLESDVKATLQKVAQNEVDAALVYRTDVLSAPAGTVAGIDFPEARRAVNAYPIATLTESADPATARAFVDYVLSEPGQAVLTRAGFARP